MCISSVFLCVLKIYKVEIQWNDVFLEQAKSGNNRRENNKIYWSDCIGRWKNSEEDDGKFAEMIVACRLQAIVAIV